MRALCAIAVALVACGGSGGASPSPRTEAFKRAVLEFNGHVIVMKTSVDFPEYREVAQRIAKVPGITSVEPFVFLAVTIGASDEEIGLKGIDPAATPLRERMTPPNALDGYRPEPPGRGDIIDPAPPEMEDIEPPGQPVIHVAMGTALAKKLDAQIGDVVDVTLTQLAPQWQPDPPRTWQVRVVALLATTIEFDERTLLTTFEAAQEVAGRGDVVMGLELRVTDPAKAAGIAKEIGALLGPPYQVMDWCELNRAAFRC